MQQQLQQQQQQSNRIVTQIVTKIVNRIEEEEQGELGQHAVFIAFEAFATVMIAHTRIPSCH